jgi:uncharacterized membrane protein
MIGALRRSNRLSEVIFLGLLAFACFALSMFRWHYTDTKTFLFLNWNLILAVIPYSITTLAFVYPRFKNSNLRLSALIAVWLLFFPNAPYILTDLFHLRKQTGMPIWFDLTLILFFAWTGLLFGFLSLRDVQNSLLVRLNKVKTTLVVVALIFIGSFGIYLGRYLRWNSWDILQEPFAIIYQIGDRFVNPLSHSRTWGMTIFFGLFLNVVYWSLKFVSYKSLKINEGIHATKPRLN